METKKLLAIIVIVILTVPIMMASFGTSDTSVSGSYNNPASTLYGKQYEGNGLSIAMDYDEEEYTINSTNVDDVGLIVCDKAIVKFSPLDDNVYIYRGNVTDSFTGTTYTLSATITNGTMSAFTESSTTVTSTITTREYFSNMAVTMTIGGTSYTGFTFSNGVVSIPLADITGNVVITASATNTSYTFTSTVTSGTSHTGTVYAGSGFTYTFVPYSSDYTYPETVVCNVAYTYNDTTGALIIGGSAINQNITITATCKAVGQGRIEVVSATGNSSQTGTPTPSNPIPVISTTYYDGNGNPVELRKVGIYEDTYSNGVITRNVGVAVFDGTESWILNGGVAGLFQKNIDNSKPQPSSPYYGLCTHFESVNLSASSISDGDSTFHGSSNGRGRISVKYLDYADNLAGFKSWVAEQYANGTPLTAYYPLLTAETESVVLYTSSIAPDIPPSTPVAITVGTPLTDTISSQSGSYTPTTTVTSLSITYASNIITITSNAGTLTVNDVSKLILLNKVLASSKYYAYTGSITSAYYDKNDAITFGMMGNGYVIAGTTQKVGTGLTITQTAHTTTQSVNAYPEDTTPVTISGVTGTQYTILEKSLTITQKDSNPTLYLIVGVIFLLVLCFIAYAIIRNTI